MSDVDDSDEFVLVLIEVGNPGASEGVVLGIEVLNELISLAFDSGNNSGNISSSSIYSTMNV